MVEEIISNAKDHPKLSPVKQSLGTICWSITKVEPDSSKMKTVPVLREYPGAPTTMVVEDMAIL